MILTIKKGMDQHKINEVLRKLTQKKKLVAKRHLGKVKWQMDALEYQKKLRNEWD